MVVKVEKMRRIDTVNVFLEDSSAAFVLLQCLPCPTPSLSLLSTSLIFIQTLGLQVLDLVSQSAALVRLGLLLPSLIR